MRSIFRPAFAALALWALPSTVLATDYPVEGDQLRIIDRSGGGLDWFYFRAVKEANITTATIADPTGSGATVEVFGSGVGDGSSGVLNLPAENWRQLTNGIGYHYHDHDAVNGVSELWLKRGVQGGTLWILARGPVWSYPVTQPQTDVMVRVIIGGDRYCAKFTNFQPNRVGITVAKKNPIILDCN